MMIKFAFVGLSGVGVNMVVYMYLIALSADYLVAAGCSFGAAVTSNFIWNVMWTFKGRAEDKSISSKYVSFFLISILNLGVNLLVLRFLVEYIHIAQTLAQLVSIAIVSGLNFLLNYRITFAEKRYKQDKEVRYPYEASSHTNLQ